MLASKTVSAVANQVARMMDVAAEAGQLRLDFPRLASAAAAPDGAIHLGFLNLTTETKFSATLRLGVSS